MLSRVKETIDDKRFIGSKSLTDTYTCIDAAYAVHSSMRSHTGGAIFMGNGVFHGKILVQMFNTKISTEVELVFVSEYLPYNL